MIAAFWLRNLGGHLLYRLGPGGVLGSGGVTTDMEATAEMDKRKMGIHLIGVSKIVGRI